VAKNSAENHSAIMQKPSHTLTVPPTKLKKTYMNICYSNLLIQLTDTTTCECLQYSKKNKQWEAGNTLPSLTVSSV